MRAFTASLLTIFACVSSAQNFGNALYRASSQEPQYAPIPYQYAYKTEADDGQMNKEETSDGQGNVKGSYSFNLADGRQRTVTYYADETGFHADVTTNEPGTESKDAADALYKSSAISGVDAALQYQPAPRPQVLRVAAPAPVVKYVQAPAPQIVKYVQAPTPQIVKYVHAPAPVTVVKTAPAPVTVVKHAPVVKYVQAAAPVAHYQYAHPSPVTYQYAHAPVSQYSFAHHDDHHDDHHGNVHVIHKA
jgi:hypothetical protein